jgi:hypothetical protein
MLFFNLHIYSNLTPPAVEPPSVGGGNCRRQFTVPTDRAERVGKKGLPQSYQSQKNSRGAVASCNLPALKRSGKAVK